MHTWKASLPFSLSTFVHRFRQFACRALCLSLPNTTLTQEADVLSQTHAHTRHNHSLWTHTPSLRLPLILLIGVVRSQRVTVDDVNRPHSHRSTHTHICSGTKGEKQTKFKDRQLFSPILSVDKHTPQSPHHVNSRASAYYATHHRLVWRHHWRALNLYSLFTSQPPWFRWLDIPSTTYRPLPSLSSVPWEGSMSPLSS